MITFTEGELRCIVDALRQHLMGQKVWPAWAAHVLRELDTAVTKFKSHVLVPADEYKERVDTTDAEGWLHRCHCGWSFTTVNRKGSCWKCGMGYEILKNREELSA